MKLLELNNSELETGYYDPAEDKLGMRKPNDLRKPKLTLRKLNKLKKMRAVKRLEDLKRQDVLSVMYGIPEEPAGGPGF